MTDPEPSGDSEKLPRALIEYTERLLLGTGLDVEQALRIARGKVEPVPGLTAPADALRAGWNLSAGPESASA
jgi:hypothetical protein